MLRLSTAPDRRESANPVLDALIDRGLDGALGVISQVARGLRSLTRREPSWGDFLISARRLIARHEPILAGTLTDSLLAGWLTGAMVPIAKLPDKIELELPSILPQPPIVRAPLPAPFNGAAEEEPLIRFPIIEKAAADLRDRLALTANDFNWLAAEAKNTAFTVSGVASLDAVEKIQDAITLNVAEGKTLRKFAEEIDDVLEETALSPVHLENVYRTNVAQAYSAGLDEVLRHPLVTDAFPYLAYHAVHDSRTKKTHLQMEKLGLNGTNVYRKDDPIWERFFPPWRWQ